MSEREKTFEIYRRVSSYRDKAPQAENKPLRPNAYVKDRQSVVALVRTNNRTRGIIEALSIIGGLKPTLAKLRGYVLIKPNLNSHDLFPGSTHPETLRTILQVMIETGLPTDQIVVGDMSGPRWLPTRETMRRNGTLDVVQKFGIKTSFFEDEEWVTVKPEKATSWPQGFTVAKTVFEASRIISLPCLKTHRFGGVFTFSLKNTVGMINPADRMYLHESKKMRDLIAEINLAYTADLVILDGMKCFITEGPEKGKEASPGIMIAGGDRVAIDAIGASILKYLNADGMKNLPVKEQEQLKRAAEIDLGQLDLAMIDMRTSNLAGDENFPQLIHYIKNELK